ncbi:MAG: radical SAM protein [Deltaproteobacteria bacterium]|nr:radical SAM protein [Deltaproteobacteria bacterium]
MKIDGIKKALHQVDKIRYRPNLVAKIGRGYFRALVLRKPCLRDCEFSITPDCQSKCSFCYASKFYKKEEELLSLDEIESTWIQAKEMGAFCANLLGGEPLLHPHFIDIIEILEPKKHLITFATNSILLTEDIIKELKRLGVFLIMISLNSLNPELNDKMRGYKGHYDHVMNAIELCIKYNIDISLPVATSKPYLKETYEIVEYAKQINASVVVNLMCAMGRTEGELDLLFDEAFWKDYRKLVDSNSHLRADFDTNLNLRIGCPAGFEKIHVTPYGEVTGCSMNPVSFGNVREKPLAEIVDKMRNFYHFAKRSPHCLVAIDRKYINDYMNYASNYESIPYRVEENDCYERDKYSFCK